MKNNFSLSVYHRQNFLLLPRLNNNFLVGEEQPSGGRIVPFRLTPNLQELLGPLAVSPNIQCDNLAACTSSEASNERRASDPRLSIDRPSSERSASDGTSVNQCTGPLCASMVVLARSLTPRGPFLAHFALGSGTGAAFLSMLRLLLAEEFHHYLRKVPSSSLSIYILFTFTNLLHFGFSTRIYRHLFTNTFSSGLIPLEISNEKL